MIKKGINTLSLAEIGKIKTGYLGAEKLSKNNKKFRPPKKLDHFVITHTQRDEKGNLKRNQEIHDKLGDKAPRSLRIRLPFDSIDKNFFTEYQYYGGRKKICSGDGITAYRRFFESAKAKLPFYEDDKKQIVMNSIQVQKGEIKEIACCPDTCEFYQGKKCKVFGSLSAFLPDSDDLGGVFKYRTHSYNSVSAILSALQYFSEQTKGILQGMPLKLVMIKKPTEEFGDIDIVTIVIDGVEIQGLRRAALAEKENRALLDVNIKDYEERIAKTEFFIDNEPEEIIQQEFYPEENKQEEPDKPGRDDIF